MAALTPTRAFQGLVVASRCQALFELTEAMIPELPGPARGRTTRGAMLGPLGGQKGRHLGRCCLADQDRLRAGPAGLAREPPPQEPHDGSWARGQMTELLQHAQVVSSREVSDDRPIAKFVAVDLLDPKAPPGRWEDNGRASVLEEDEWSGLPGGEDHSRHDHVARSDALEFLERDVREREPQPRTGDGQADRAALTCRGASLSASRLTQSGATARRAASRSFAAMAAYCAAIGSSGISRRRGSGAGLRARSRRRSG